MHAGQRASFLSMTLNLCEYPTPELDGYTTYRIYANLTNEYDFVSAVYGDSQDPMFLNNTDIFQSAAGGDFASNCDRQSYLGWCFSSLAVRFLVHHWC